MLPLKANTLCIVLLETNILWLYLIVNLNGPLINWIFGLFDR